jgi:hypothetical protein
MGEMGEGKVRDYTFSLPFSLPTPLKYCKKIYAPVPPPPIIKINTIYNIYAQNTQNTQIKL